MFCKNDTICFFGDSITTNGLFIKEIYEYLIKNHGDKRVKIFNCGVPGDCAYKAVGRIYGDCLSYNPDKVFIMFGVNDIGREFFNLSEPSSEDKKRESLEDYKKTMTELITTIENHNSEVVLMTPTPVIEKRTKTDGCNKALEDCIAFLRETAKNKNLKLIDLYSVMSSVDNSSLIKLDGVHPTEEGHHMMAQIILKELGYIDETDFENIPSFCEENDSRYEAEQDYRNLMFVEKGVLYRYLLENPKASLNEKKEFVKTEKHNDEPDDNWWNVMIDFYLTNIDFLFDYHSDLIKKSIDVYKGC